MRRIYEGEESVDFLMIGRVNNHGLNQQSRAESARRILEWPLTHRADYYGLSQDGFNRFMGHGPSQESWALLNKHDSTHYQLY